MTFDRAGHWRVWSNREAVTLRVAADAGAADHAVAQAKRRAVTSREQQASGGRYVGSDVNWWLPAELLDAGVVPKPADAVIDAAGNRWVALDVTPAVYGTAYKLTTRNLKVALGLRHLIDVYRPAVGYFVPRQAQDAAGRRAPAFDLVAAAVVCSVRETGRQVVQAMGKEVTEVTYEVRVETPLALTHEDQVRWTPPGETTPRVLEVTGSRDAGRIDELQEIDCVWRGF